MAQRDLGLIRLSLFIESEEVMGFTLGSQQWGASNEVANNKVANCYAKEGMSP